MSRKPDLPNLYRRFLASNPSNQDLLKVVEHNPQRVLRSPEAARLYPVRPTARQVRAMRMDAALRLLRNNPDNDQLCGVMVLMPKLAVKAGEMLLRQTREIGRVLSVMQHVPVLREKAWELFHGLSHDEGDLAWVAIHMPGDMAYVAWRALIVRHHPKTRTLIDVLRASERFRKDALEALLSEKRTNDEIKDALFLSSGLSDAEREEASKQLLTRTCSADDLYMVLLCSKTLAIEAAERLLKRGDSLPEHLAGIAARSEPSLRNSAWKQLRARPTSAGTLIPVMQSCPELREAAWRKFVLSDPQREDLSRLWRNVPALRERLSRLLLKQGPDHPLRQIFGEALLDDAF